MTKPRPRRRRDTAVPAEGRTVFLSLHSRIPRAFFRKSEPTVWLAWGSRRAEAYLSESEDDEAPAPERRDTAVSAEGRALLPPSAKRKSEQKVLLAWGARRAEAYLSESEDDEAPAPERRARKCPRRGEPASPFRKAKERANSLARVGGSKG